MNTFQKIMRANDLRWDGQFYVGVKTTGIFCRPSCPARPKLENCVFFESSEEAINSGLRACLRCHPTGHSPSELATNILNDISKSFLETNALSEIAKRYSLTPRSLDRVFTQYFGVTPSDMIRQLQLHSACKLLRTSNDSITEVALKSGHGSIRSFNDRFQKHFGIDPSTYSKQSSADFVFSLELPFTPPIDLEGIKEHFNNHALPGLDEVSNTSYKRFFYIDGVEGSLTIEWSVKKNRIPLHLVLGDSKILSTVVAKVRNMIDLDHNPKTLETSFDNAPVLKSLYQNNPGLRVVRGFNAFEVLTTTVLGQLVSMKQANRLIEQLISVHHQMGGKGFPGPNDLLKIDLSDLKTSQKRKDCLRNLGKDFEALNLDVRSNWKDQLLEFPGIGTWTAEYFGLRWFPTSDCFPGTDLVLKKRAHLISREELKSTSPWQPYSALYIWRHGENL